MNHLHALVFGAEKAALQAAEPLRRQGVTLGGADGGDTMSVLIASLSVDAPGNAGARVTLTGDLLMTAAPDPTFWRGLAAAMGARADDRTIERIISRLEPGGAVVLGVHPPGTLHAPQPPSGAPSVTVETIAPSAFARFARQIAWLAGSPGAFALALGLIAVWAATGPIFGFSDTWQLVINTGTTVVTFLMVFVIQNAQNRDGEAIQVKLDELVRATQNARNTIIGIEKLDDAHVRALEAELEAQRGDNDVAEEPNNNIR
jgi:low affinity Fe/Cu permease